MIVALLHLTLAVNGPAACPPGERWDDSMAMCMPAEPGLEASNARTWDEMTSPDRCGSEGYFQFGMSMCEPRPGRPGRISAMVMGNVFAAGILEEGLRGRTAVSAPNWLMLDTGIDLAKWNRLELDAMLTGELWTTPSNGYPELLQIGEDLANGQPFLDAQHPHSSPIMGLTLTDVISWSQDSTRLLRLFFAPRGESTDGPIAFMHRPTGTVNPDVPLGHHIGQDVGHVSSTVFGASLYLGSTIIEASTFSGREPEPTQVDLPLGVPDSLAFRISELATSHLTGSASMAYVTNPEGDPTIPHVWRLSASAYTQHEALETWRLHTMWAWGGMVDYDHAKFLNSFIGEGLLTDERANAVWGRIEVLQRTPGELEIPLPSPNVGRWTGATTLGVTRKLLSAWHFDFSVGFSATATLLPDDYAGAYGGNVIFSGKLFLEPRFLGMFASGGR